MTALLAGAQALPGGGLTVRSPQPLDADEAASWQVISASVSLSAASSTFQLALQLQGSVEPLTISPWPASQRATQHTATFKQSAQALGLGQRAPLSGVKLTAVQTAQPFGPALHLSVQQGTQQPSLVVQTRGQSGQAVVAGWRAVYAGQGWVLQNELADKPALDASRTQRIRSAGRAWCVYPTARPAGPEGQESPPLLDWVLRVAPAKGRC